MQAVGTQVDASYLQCDLTDPDPDPDPDSVRGALGETAAYGPLRGVLHGAAHNQPRRLGQITAESLAATLAPKVDGLRTLLGELERRHDELSLCLGFGSIIGRCGLTGQAEYSIPRTHPHKMITDQTRSTVYPTDPR